MPSLITHTGPGDPFVERNPGNIVPLYSDAFVGVSASIQYAIRALHVRNIIVCSHSDCGAVKGILHPQKVAAMPAVARRLDYGARACDETLQRPARRERRRAAWTPRVSRRSASMLADGGCRWDAA